VTQIPSRAYILGDLDPVLDLLVTWRTVVPFDRLGAYPTTRRLDLLLTLRLWDPAFDARIWHTAAGRPIGFAALWSREREDAYRGLEGPLVHPALDGVEHTALQNAIMVWAQRRVGELGRQCGVPLVLTNPVRQTDEARRTALERWGFALHLARANVYWERALYGVPAPSLPDSFAVRPLAGEQELDTYARSTASGSSTACIVWRCCTIPSMLISWS
jgi:hypothetical protein